ncbi:MAG: hypothetical protein HY526_08785 [Betaproteobacteria bacterium]|nr:hypothetical protein [Betaproteobacteria bacterium]
MNHRKLGAIAVLLLVTVLTGCAQQRIGNDPQARAPWPEQSGSVGD